MFRILRSLRIINYNKGLKVVVSALLNAMPQILNVIWLSILFFLIFGIIALNYLKG